MDNAPEAIDTLETFFEAAKTGALFTDNDPAALKECRTRVRKALTRLLVWGRPELERERALAWPYDALSKLAPEFTRRAAAGGPEASQAEAFLTLLPFPGQWRWLDRAESAEDPGPEIARFLTREKEKIDRKLEKKRQKTFKLRHFCQVLKAPDLPREKGILRIFSIPYLFTTPGLLERLQRLYFLYVEPAAGVVYRHTWMRRFAKAADPVLFGLSCREDAAFHESQGGVLTTALAHGDYLETDLALPAPQAIAHDIVFNATFDEMERKRHHLMLDLLRHPKLSGTSALFLGRGAESSVAAFKESVAQSGLSDRVTVLSNIMRKTVPEHLSRCRIGVHLALHENGCRCVYEFFRSDLPVVVSTSMAGINLAIINGQTGIAAADDDLPHAIYEALERPGQFAPRRWFLENSGAENSSAKLNATLKAIFGDLGYTWGSDIAPLSSSGANRYLYQEDYRRFAPQFDELFGLMAGLDGLPIRLDAD